jgi:hypothetical protein
MVHLCQAKSHFWLGPVKDFEASNQIWAKAHMVCTHMSSHLLLLDNSMSSICDQCVMGCFVVKQAPMGTLLCQAKSLFLLGPFKSLKHPTKSGPKLTWFAVMTPHLLLLDHSISSICDP